MNRMSNINLKYYIVDNFSSFRMFMDQLLQKARFMYD